MQRRTFVLGSLATAGLVAAGVKPKDNGQAYDTYFGSLNTELQQKGQFVPRILVDLDKLDSNIQVLQQQLNAQTDLRIVAKSLPSPELLGYVMEQAQTNKLMVFHQPFLTDIAKRYPQSDLLLGKPMPVKAAERFYQLFTESETDFRPEQQLQWLIDTPERAEQYLALAKKVQRKLLLNLELDVGLHRGGLNRLSQLDDIVSLIEQHPEYIELSGFMGYDPHVVKLPSIVKSAEQAYLESQAIYQTFIEHLYKRAPRYQQIDLTFNGAGSPTIAMHQVKTVCNELSAGSCLVKPSDFDIPSLSAFEPAAFIASPILKKLKGTEIPALEFAKDMLPLWDPNLQHTYFIYGGKWMADFESPRGLQNNGLYGSSTNQQIVNGSKLTNLQVDDHIFLRPHQSEAVFLQFGQVTAIRQQTLLANWNILSQV